MHLAGRPVEDDVSGADWIAAAVRDQDWATVGSLVPPVFEAYARVFHPAVRYPFDDAYDPAPAGAVVTSLPPDEDVSWAEVAGFNGRIAHPAMEWASITGSWEFRDSEDQPGMWNDAPAEGHLPSPVAGRMAAVLARHTATPTDCWFGIWSGFGYLARTGPELVIPGREYVLVRGPIELAAENLAPEPSEQSANVWWPADRAWCVATDIDLMTTYVGGSAACVADLLGAGGLEVAPASPGQRVSWDADTVNPRPLGAPA